MRKDLNIEYIYFVNEILSNKSPTERLWTERGFQLIDQLLSIKYKIKKSDDLIFDLSNYKNLFNFYLKTDSKKLKNYFEDLGVKDFYEITKDSTIINNHLSARSQLSCLGQIDLDLIIKTNINPELLCLYGKLDFPNKYRQNFHKIDGYVFKNGIYDLNTQIMVLCHGNKFYTYDLTKKSISIKDLEKEEENNFKIDIMKEISEYDIKKLLTSNIQLDKEIKKEELEDLILLNYGE